jgi:hypothetical protein
MVDGNYRMYKRDGSRWDMNDKGWAVEIAVGNRRNVWCRNSAGNIFKLTGSGFNGEWEQDDDAFNVVSISVDEDGEVWTCNTSGQVHRRDPEATGDEDKWSQAIGP